MGHSLTATIDERLREVGLSAERSIVIGSGLLDKLGIRIAEDIDLVVDDESFVSLGERTDLKRYEDDRGVHYQTNDGVIELWRTWGLPGEAERTYSELLPDTSVHDGVRYVTLDYLKRWKQKKGREKDLRDMELIKRYEAMHG